MAFAISLSALVMLAVGSAILVLPIWSVRRFVRPGSKTATTPMEKILGLLSIFFLAVLIWVGWKFQPWMAAGRAVHLSTMHIGDYDFQVWQRKNSILTEPFTTWLFARKQGHKWMSFMLDFEDT